MEAHLTFCLKALNKDMFVKAAFLDSLLNQMWINGRSVPFILSTISPKKKKGFIKGFRVRLLQVLNQSSSRVGVIWKLSLLVYRETCFHDSKAELRIYFQNNLKLTR